MSTRTVLNLRQVACACFWKLAYFCLLMIGCTSAYHLSSMQWDSKHLGGQCFYKSTHHNTNIRSISQKLTVLWSVMWIWPSLSCFLLEMSSLFRKHEAPLYLAPFHTPPPWTYHPICNCKPKQSEWHFFLKKWGQGWRVQTPECTKERRSQTEKTQEDKEKVGSGGQKEQKVPRWEKLFRL